MNQFKARFLSPVWRVVCLALALCCSFSMDAAATNLPGKFIWAELVTDDLPTAQRFYGELLGWTFTDVDGYITAFNGQEPVAGMFYHARPKDRLASPRWICYISSKDIGAFAQSVLAAGGSVRTPPQQTPGHGERVILADAEGALFGAMHLQGPDPEDYLADNGSWIWLQLLSRNVTQAASFYKAVGGYELFEDRGANDAERYLLARGGYARAAILPLSLKRQQEGVQPMWLPFIRVENVHAIVARVPALGGKVVVAPHEALFDGRVALLEDSTGGLVGIMEWQAEDAGDDGSHAP